MISSQTGQKPPRTVHKIGTAVGIVVLMAYCVGCTLFMFIGAIGGNPLGALGFYQVDVSGTYQGDLNGTTISDQDAMSMNLAQKQGTLTGQLQLVDDNLVMTKFTLSGTVTQTYFTKLTDPETTKEPVYASFRAVSTNKRITLTFTGQANVSEEELTGTFVSSLGDHGTWEENWYCDDCESGA